MKTIINIQSISDLITNSSTEVFVVYDKSNITSIKNLVNAILSLIDSDKTFDDYFNIEMRVDYEVIYSIFDKYCYNEDLYDDVPELKEFANLDYEASNIFIRSLSLKRLEEIINWANNCDYYNTYLLYSGFSVTSKTADPVVAKVAGIINGIDDIFEIDYNSEY